MIQALLLEEGIPSLARRSGGFDVPDFLAAGPRDVMVAAGGLDAARELLGDAKTPRRLPPERHPPWMRALAFTLAFTVIVALRRERRRAVLRLSFTPRRDARGGCATPPRCGGTSAGTRSPARGSARPGAARGRASRTRGRPPRGRAGRRPSRRAAARPTAKAERTASGPSRRRRATAGRTWRVWPESHCAAPSTSHAQRPQRASRCGLSGRRELRVLVGDVAAGEQRGRREHQHLQRALDVGGAVGEQPRAEDVQLALAGDADDVAARGGRGQPAGERRATAARRRAGPARSAGRPRAPRGALSKRSSRRVRANSSCASTRAASSSSRSSWRATNVSEAVSTQAMSALR